MEQPPIPLLTLVQSCNLIKFSKFLFGALQIAALKMRRVGRIRQDTHTQAGYSGALRGWLQVRTLNIAMIWSNRQCSMTTIG